MKRTVGALLLLAMLLALCSCGTGDGKEKETAEPKASGVPLTDKDIWAQTVLDRYNMNYADYAEYWSMICDCYFGEDFVSLVNILSGCENLGFSLTEKNAEIEKRRSEYAEKYGSDWHFEYVGCETEPLEARANEDFATELENLYARIFVLTNEAARWNDSAWNNFADGLGCDTETARKIVELYAAMGEKCHEASVEEACAIKVTLKYSDSETVYGTWLYKVNGVYVSQELIDNTLALINLIYC